MAINTNSHLFITLDSCRFDVFQAANTPNMDKVGNLYKARSPSFFTFPSHKAMFAGFTPAVHGKGRWLNPKHGKLYRITSSNVSNNPNDHILLKGRNIIRGFNNLGYETIGTGAVRWFDDRTDAGEELSCDFKHYKYFGDLHYLHKQVPWVRNLSTMSKQNTFCFINVGETHDPYTYPDSGFNSVAAYKRLSNKEKAREEVLYQQKKCVEYIDSILSPLLNLFMRVNATIIITADHGELFGEDGLWQHQDMHEMTTTVPLIMNVKGNKL